MAADAQKNEGLQAARAIAALSVAYFHSYVALRSAFPENTWQPIPWLSHWGFLGVDFFFAISGYVICLVVAKPSFTLRGFVIKRVFRLYPMYWVALAIMLLLIYRGRMAGVPAGHFLYSMTLLPQQGAPAYAVSWTLERELVFYVMAAAVVAICGARAGIPVLAVLLGVLAYAGLHFGNPWTFHVMSSLQADFLAGVVVFMARAPLRWVGSVLPLAAGVALLACMTQGMTPWAVPLSAGLLLAGMVYLELPWSRAPFSWLVAAGNASYSIYLLHYMVFLMAAVVSVEWLSLPAWACEPWRFGSILACCLISCATFRLIEHRAIKLSERLSRADYGLKVSGAKMLPVTGAPPEWPLTTVVVHDD